MIITENFIRMCEQAEEIQKEWLPVIGDLCIHDHNIRWLIRFKKDIDRIDKNIDKWLPTQEQLWDMLEGTVLEKLDNFMANLTVTVYETVQEHLLNHVMEHNYGKMWLNKKWEAM